MSIENKIKAKIEETQKKLAHFGYQHFSINFEVSPLKKGISGVANLSTDRIRISPDYLREFEEQILSRTVPHEVCHLYVHRYFNAKQFHGPEFRALMHLVGADSSSKHSMLLKEGSSSGRKVKRFIYKTERTKREIQLTTKQHENAQRGAAYRVKGEKIVYDNKMITI